MLHTINHSLTKAMLFLAAGNILALYRTKSTTEVHSVLRTMPLTGVLWFAGFLAIAGSPPFGLFLSELTILKGVLDVGRPAIAAAFLAAIAAVFIGMATVVLRMTYGRTGEYAIASAPRPEPLWSVVPAALLGTAVLMLGLYIPAPLDDLLHQAAAVLGAN
jgi:hydrogenase-4 component F